jgi:hypothetical protein
MGTAVPCLTMGLPSSHLHEETKDNHEKPLVLTAGALVEI